MVQMNLEKNWRKEIQKKKWKRGQALLGQPRLPFGPGSGPACLPLPSPARGRPPRPSQRRPRGGRTPAMGAPRPTGFTWSGRRPEPPGRSIRSVARASLPPPSARERNRSRRSSAAAPSPEKLRCSPPATLVPQSRRQNHQRARRRRGKLLRTLYRGESPSNTVNRSSELLRPRRRAPPRRTSLVSASFRLLFGALDP